jgi:hypothetical protein
MGRAASGGRGQGPLAEDDEPDLRRLSGATRAAASKGLVASFVLERNDRSDKEFLRPDPELPAQAIAGRLQGEPREIDAQRDDLDPVLGDAAADENGFDAVRAGDDGVDGRERQTPFERR